MHIHMPVSNDHTKPVWREKATQNDEASTVRGEVPRCGNGSGKGGNVNPCHPRPTSVSVLMCGGKCGGVCGAVWVWGSGWGGCVG